MSRLVTILSLLVVATGLASTREILIGTERAACCPCFIILKTFN